MIAYVQRRKVRKIPNGRAQVSTVAFDSGGLFPFDCDQIGEAEDATASPL